MKKNYTNPSAELFALCASDVIANSILSRIVDDIVIDVYEGAGEGYEKVF